MRAFVVDVCLAITVFSVWIGCLGFVRLRTTLDRLHCATFVNASAGFSLTLAVVIQDGISGRSLKTAALLILTLLVGSATSHAIGRAIYLRDGEGG